jgi:ubiquinone/menaquinone biosynthesis C-methylase UbiE
VESNLDLKEGLESARVTLVSEYRKQFAWRDWNRALSLCPLTPGQRVLDLGCGAGDVSGVLAARGLVVTGVDANEELLAAAQARYPQCRFERQDLRRLEMPPGTFDGLWCSFAAAYFVDFPSVWSSWASLLKPTAWVCVIDIDDLLAHQPLSAATEERIKSFYADALVQRRYDFNVGRKLHSALEALGFTVTQFELEDRELSFDGPAQDDVLEAWEQRFARLGGLAQFLGADFRDFQTEFMRCLSSPEHRSRCRVIGCVGTRAR